MHGFSTIVPFPWQRGHGCENAKRPCESETTPRPAHCGQTTGDVPGSAPVPWQTEHAPSDLDGDAHLHALERVLEGDANARLEIVAARRAAALRRGARAAEHPAEEIAEVAEVELLEARRRLRRRRRPETPARPRRRTCRTCSALLGVGEQVVGGLHLLELLLGPVVARVPVRVVLARE